MVTGWGLLWLWCQWTVPGCPGRGEGLCPIHGLQGRPLRVPEAGLSPYPSELGHNCPTPPDHSQHQNGEGSVLISAPGPGGTVPIPAPTQACPSPSQHGTTARPRPLFPVLLPSPFSPSYQSRVPFSLSHPSPFSPSPAGTTALIAPQGRRAAGPRPPLTALPRRCTPNTAPPRPAAPVSRSALASRSAPASQRNPGRAMGYNPRAGGREGQGELHGGNKAASQPKGEQG